MRSWRPPFGRASAENREAHRERYLGELAPLLDAARPLDALSPERKRQVRRRILRTALGSRRTFARTWLAPTLIALAALVVGGAAFATAERLGLIPSVRKPAAPDVRTPSPNPRPTRVLKARPIVLPAVPDPVSLPLPSDGPAVAPVAVDAAGARTIPTKTHAPRAVAAPPRRRASPRLAYLGSAPQTAMAERNAPAAAPVVSAAPAAPSSPMAPQWVEPVYVPIKRLVDDAPRAAPYARATQPIPALDDKLQAIPTDSALFGEAMRKLRMDRNPSGALAALQAHARSYPRSSLSSERAVLEVEALLALRRERDALTRLDAMPLAELPRSGERLVVRGELRAAARRWSEASADFDEALARVSGSPSWHERALWGRAVARLRCGEREAGLADVERYHDEYPDGRFAAEALRFLSAR